MKTSAPMFLAASAFLLAQTAFSTPLTVVNVSAPNVNCVFDPSCKVTVTDSVGNYPPSNRYTGQEILQSRTFMGQPGTAGAGKTAYLYRVDFSQAKPVADQACALNLKIDFGPVAPLPYNGTPADVFVVTQGGLGSVGVASADETGGVITFTFAASPLAVCPGSSSFFFGLASNAQPRAVTAQSEFDFGGGTASVAARSPAAHITRRGIRY